MKKPIELENVAELLMRPALQALEKSNQKRNCSEYSDEDHLRVGIERVIQNEKSGRRWLVRCFLSRNIKVSVRNFFKTLESKRRTRMVTDVSQRVRSDADAQECGGHNDPLAIHPELDGFAVYASDGHSHAAGSHEKPIEGKIRAINHIYTLNLRSHFMEHITLTQPAKGKKKEHEICALKRMGSKTLRMREKTGTKVIHAYDPAIVDYRQWYCWKQASGIYIITMEKINSAFDKQLDLLFDAEDPRNTGILSDEMLTTSKGYEIRRIRYCDPESGKIYSYLTTEFTLPPGLLAFIYKLRWDAEKTFDQVKNIFGETKAWATSTESKNQQAGFIALAHNLTLLLERDIEAREGIRDEKVEKRKAARIEKATESTRLAGRVFNPLVGRIRRVSKRSVQFIGWIQSCLEHQTPWPVAIEQLRPLMSRYL